MVRNNHHKSVNPKSVNPKSVNPLFQIYRNNAETVRINNLDN